MNRAIKQGDILLVDLGKNKIGSEQMGNRPCLVLSNNISNASSTLVIIAPITSKKKKNLPTHHILKKEKYNFLIYDKNIVLCENIVSISKSRLVRYIGQIDKDDLNEIIKKLNNNFSKNA